MPQHYCSACSETVEASVDAAEGHSFCPACGLQLEDVYLESGPTFVQDGNFSHLAGTVVREDDLGREGATIGGFAGSRERSASKGKTLIRNFATQLDIPEAPTYVEQAARIYQLAMSSGFTRGRRVNQVAAACLYIVLRQDRRPYLLIDFCKLVNVNVYVLGSTYLRLSQKLRFSSNPVHISLVDPSLYIHRFAGKLNLPQQKQSVIVSTSMHFIATMKRDWMQTGRRPAGVCGAALFLACHVHGEKISRRDIIKAVSVGESTLLNRIADVKNTDASDLPLQDFCGFAQECHQQQLALEGYTGAEGEVAPMDDVPSGAKCRHVINNNVPELFMGMCQSCFSDYAKSSGGIVRGAEDPPAFKRNLVREIKVMRRQATEEAIKLLTTRLASGAPGSIAGGSMSMGLTGPAEFADVAEAGPSTSQALVCYPGNGTASNQAGTSRALVCLPETGATKGGVAPPAGCGDPASIVRETREDSAGKTKDSRRRQTRQAAQKRITKKGRKGVESSNEDDDEEEWVMSDWDTDSDSDKEFHPTVRKKSGKADAPKKRGRPRKNKPAMVDSSLEAEFALAYLQNSNVQEIVRTLEISNAELPAYSVQQARELLAKSKDPFAEVQAAAAAEEAERNENMRTYERLRADYRADPVTYSENALRSFRFLELQNGADLSLVSEPVKQILTADMRARAADLAAQNAELTNLAQVETTKKREPKQPLFGGLLAEEVENAVNAEIEEQVEEAAPDLPDTFSDLDDDELDACLCTDSEAQTKKAIWDHTHREYLEMQAEKEASAAELASNPQLPTKKTRKRPVIQFQQGATAQESVERMLQSKHLDGQMNQDIVNGLFETAEAIARNGANLVDGEIAPDEAPSMAQHIRQAQETIASTANAKIDKHQAALMREQSNLQGGLLENLARDTAKPKRPFRLGRLR